jgi:hypothetical protein
LTSSTTTLWTCPAPSSRCTSTTHSQTKSRKRGVERIRPIDALNLIRATVVKRQDRILLHARTESRS